MPAVFGFPSIDQCVPDGGAFALVIPPVAGVLLAIEVVWLLVIGTRALKRRADLLKVRDLLIEGSIGQAILLSDRRQKDDVLAVCRAGIVAVQSSGGDRATATDRITQEAGFRFGTTLGTRARVVVLVLMVIVPLGLALTGRAYAERVLLEASTEIPEAHRASILAEVREDPPFACPFTLGVSGAFALLLPALLIGFLEGSRRSQATRAHAVLQAEMFADMASVVIAPASRAYRDERR